MIYIMRERYYLEFVNRGCNISECGSVSFFRTEWNIYPVLPCFCIWSCTQGQIPERHGRNYAPGIVLNKYSNIAVSTALQHWFKNVRIYVVFMHLCVVDDACSFRLYTSVDWCGGWWIGKDLKGSCRDYSSIFLTKISFPMDGVTNDVRIKSFPCC